MYLQHQPALELTPCICKGMHNFHVFLCFIQNSMHQCSWTVKVQLETAPKTVDENDPSSNVSHQTPCKFVF